MLALQRKPLFTAAPPDPTRTRATVPRFSIFVALAVGRTWRERARHRWELSQMSARDLADLGIPYGSAAQEMRR